MSADAGKDVEKGKHSSIVGGIARWSNHSGGSLENLEIVLLEDPAIPLLDMYPNDAPTYNKDTCSTMFIAVIFIIARSCKEPRCPSKEEWIQKTWFIYTVEDYSAIKNNDFIKFTDKWMEIVNITLSEVIQLQKNIHGMYSLIREY